MNNRPQKFKLGKEALIFSIMTLVTVLTWVFFETYRTMTESTISKVTRQQMAVINPQLEKEVIQSLKAKIQLAEQELNFVPPEVGTEAASQDENDQQD